MDDQGPKWDEQKGPEWFSQMDTVYGYDQWVSGGKVPLIPVFREFKLLAYFKQTSLFKKVTDFCMQTISLVV